VIAMPAKKKGSMLKESIEDLLNVGDNLKSIEPAELNLPATKLDEVQGWWIALRDSAIARCMGLYLAIMRKQRDITLHFIDLQAGPGMHIVFRESGANHVIPGPPMLAAWQAGFGTDARFDHVHALTSDKDTTIALRQRLELLKMQLVKNGIPASAHHVYSSTGDGDSTDQDTAMNDFLHAIKAHHGKFYHYLCFMDSAGLKLKFSTILKLRNILPYGDVIIDYDGTAIESALSLPRGHKVLDEFFGTAVPRGDVAFGLKELYVNQLQLAGFKGINSISAAPSGYDLKHELFFCSRSEKPAWTAMIGTYNTIASGSSVASIGNFWDSIGRKAPTLLDMLAMVNDEMHPSVVADAKSSKEPIDILLSQGDDSYTKPLMAGTDDAIWKSILSKNLFDMLKINGDMVVLKKRISNTDLAMKSACIQGKIREKLGISALETREILLLDRRTRQFGTASFPGDGRLDGTAFWLQLHKDTLQDGNYCFLAKVEDMSKIVIIIDYYQQLYPIISFLQDYYRFYKDIKQSNLATVVQASE
jgi:hypothetical protein